MDGKYATLNLCALVYNTESHVTTSLLPDHTHRNSVLLSEAASPMLTNHSEVCPLCHYHTSHMRAFFLGARVRWDSMSTIVPLLSAAYYISLEPVHRHNMMSDERHGTIMDKGTLEFDRFRIDTGRPSFPLWPS